MAELGFNMNRYRALGLARYGVVGGSLGALWFLALLIPPGTSHFLLVPDWQNLQVTWPGHLAAMCSASLLLSLLFRGVITRARHWPVRLLLAALLPIVGTVLYVCGLIIFALLSGATLATGTAYPAWVQVLSLAFFMALYGQLFLLAAIYVVFPMGLLSQLVMERVGRKVLLQQSRAT